MILSQIVSAGHGLDAAHDPDIARYDQQRWKRESNLPFQILNCLLIGSAPTIRVSPFGHGHQYLAYFGAAFDQFCEIVVVYHLVLVVPSLISYKKWSRIGILTLEKTETTDLTIAFTLISKVSWAAGSISMSGFDPVVVVVAELDSRVQDSKLAMVQYGGRWGREQVVGCTVYAWSAYRGTPSTIVQIGIHLGRRRTEVDVHEEHKQNVSAGS